MEETDIITKLNNPSKYSYASITNKLDTKVNNIITITNDTTFKINNNEYTGKDIEELFKLTSTLKKLYPELFLMNN